MVIVFILEVLYLVFINHKRGLAFSTGFDIIPIATAMNSLV